jgi:hypothetical protein
VNPGQQAFPIDEEPPAGPFGLPVPLGTKVRIVGESGTYTLQGVRRPLAATESVQLMSEDQQWRCVKRDRVKWPKEKRPRRGRTRGAK